MPGLTRRRVLALCGAAVTAGCSAGSPTETTPRPTTRATTTTSEPQPPRPRREDFTFADLPYLEWPASGGLHPYEEFPANYDDPGPHWPVDDLDALPRLRTYRGKDGMTHPLGTARQLNRVAQSIWAVNEPGPYIEAADRLTDAFTATATEVDGALYFPYEFDYNVHGREREHLPHPWYSGIAQGTALGAFARLGWLTDDDRYGELAAKTYESFAQPRDPGASAPWIATVDDDGYYWIEEYPLDRPAHTLNGKLFGVYGLYEYWRVSGREGVADRMREALTTVLEYMPAFRRPRSMSRYCLKHDDVWIPRYHYIHIEQLHFFYQATGDTRFAEWASRLRADYWRQ